MISKALLAFTVLIALVSARPDVAERRNEERLTHPHLSRATPANVDASEYEFDNWNTQARETIAAKKAIELNKNVAKNVIMFLGDGMSLSTIKAARVYEGQQNGENGENHRLGMEYLPYSGLSKTYCLDAQVPDSACTATAYLRGIKANYGTIGVGGYVGRGDCVASLEESNRVDSIATWSQAAGKRTGIVTTMRVTHASPAGAYAYTAERDWENDIKLTEPDCEDIAIQLIHGKTGQNFNVALGGGRQNFLPDSVVDEEGFTGNREDGRNLIEEWLASKESEKAEYVWNRAGLLEAAEENDYLLGLFEGDHMKYYLDDPEQEEVTLEEMTEAAIKVLSKGENGYFLFVEGGKIDYGHHDNYAEKSLSETVEFSKAINKARELTSEEDTLIVVTSDHSHVFTVSGYATRGTDILGLAGVGDDDIPYPILSYANGPGYRPDENGVRHDFSQDDFTDINLRYPAMAPLSSETHSGEEVGIFASGPWAHMFTGVIEQNVIPHIMAFASCVGEGETACN